MRCVNMKGVVHVPLIMVKEVLKKKLKKIGDYGVHVPLIMYGLTGKEREDIAIVPKHIKESINAQENVTTQPSNEFFDISSLQVSSQRLEKVNHLNLPILLK